MDFLGRGLESLIPKKDSAPQETPPLEILDEQEKLREPAYRFRDKPAGAASETAVKKPAFVARSPLLPTASGRREESVFWIEVSKIEPNPQQPRRQFDTDELLALTSSIKEHGVLQPLLVTKKEIDSPAGLSVRYELLAGERRWRAARLAGLREVPVIVRTAEVSDRNKLEIALIENVQREDLNPLERAKAFARLADEFGLMQKDIAQRIGKSRETVTNALRILRLPEGIQAAVASNAISEGHARLLLTFENDPERQRELFRRMTSENLSVRDAELVAETLGGGLIRRTRRRRGLTSALDPDARELQRKLEEVFGTRVSLIRRGEHGRIVVEFYSDEELRGILDRIAKREEGYI